MVCDLLLLVLLLLQNETRMHGGTAYTPAPQNLVNTTRTKKEGHRQPMPTGANNDHGTTGTNNDSRKPPPDNREPPTAEGTTNDDGDMGLWTTNGKWEPLILGGATTNDEEPPIATANHQRQQGTMDDNEEPPTVATNHQWWQGAMGHNREPQMMKGDHQQ